jgi:hypothetical protein
MEEQWRWVMGHEGRYEVSNLGRVKSHIKAEPKILRPGKASNGYLTVCFHTPKRRSYPIQHLVAEAFIGPRPEGMCVLHSDGDRTNNICSNLRYGTHAENNADMLRHNRRKWTEDQIRELKRRLQNGEPPLALAKEYGMHHPQVYGIKNGRCYAWV